MFARTQIQTWLQHLLEEEVSELLGWDRYARRDGVGVPLGYRHGSSSPTEPWGFGPRSPSLAESARSSAAGTTS